MRDIVENIRQCLFAEGFRKLQDNRATDIDVETFYEIDRVVQTIKEERCIPFDDIHLS